MPSVSLMNIDGSSNVLESKLLNQIQAPSTCANFKMTWPNFVRDSASGLYYVEDRRLELYDATDSMAPAKTRMLGNRCPRVPRTFLNEDTCIPRVDCGAPVFGGEFRLTAANMRKFYELDNKVIILRS